jgi:hypothetical protein
MFTGSWLDDPVEKTPPPPQPPFEDVPLPPVDQNWWNVFQMDYENPPGPKPETKGDYPMAPNDPVPPADPMAMNDHDFLLFDPETTLDPMWPADGANVPPWVAGLALGIEKGLASGFASLGVGADGGGGGDGGGGFFDAAWGDISGVF